MGLKLTLEADQNFMGVKFEDAYWKLTNFGFGEYNGGYVISLKLSAFPSRESCKLTEQCLDVDAISTFGASARPVYDSVLYEWNALFPVSEVFPEYVPTDMDQAKTTAYSFIKSYLSEVPFSDVFEQGQAG